MRFAYIDSQGNEVTIPSIDALALRIELGAIGPDTQLYDAQADRWGPAQTHEIFHTLSRSVADEGTFVAPPPPMAATPPDEDEPAAVDKPAAFDVAGDLGLAPERPPDAPVDAGSAGSDDDLGFDFTLAEPPAPEGADSDPAAETEFEMSGFGGPLAPDTQAEAKEEPAAFDFGDLGALELESDPGGEPEPAAPMAFDGGDDVSMDFSPGAGSGMAGLDIEPPMSDFGSSAPPAWMEQSGPSDDDGAVAFARDASADEEEERPSRRPPVERADEEGSRERPERPQPRSRPSPPKRIRRRSPGGLFGVLVLIAVLGGGGYFGWTTFFQGRDSGSRATTAAVLPAVTIPDIPAELLPVMRDLGEGALSATITELSASPGDLGLPAEPNDDWLAGAYLANASRFGDVQEYWEGIGDFVDHVRANDTRVFHDRYVERLESAGIAGDTASMLLARADSGFLATQADRFEIYAQMDDLVTASLDLHAFLLRNEANIEYAPAGGGVSRDPVLEAVPASRELGREMWSMVDRITEALDALGTLDRVTTERLSAVLFDRVRRAGFR